MNPAVVQIHTRQSTVCHACADRTGNIIDAAHVADCLVEGCGCIAFEAADSSSASPEEEK